MKKLAATLTAVRMLGVFGFILVSAVIIISVSIFNVFLIDEGIIEIHEHSERRFLLENIEYYLLELELAERMYILYDGASEIEDKYAAANDALDHLIPSLIALHANPEEIRLIEEDRQHIVVDFAKIVEMYEGGEINSIQQLDEIFLSEADIVEQLDDLVFESETTLEEDLHAVSLENQRATLNGFAGLIAFPILAVWAFLVASKLTQPLLSITNAVIAIGGYRYRQELMDEALDRHDGLGKLARKIDLLADTVKSRETALEQELHSLRDQLHEARHRKLIVTSGNRTVERHTEFSAN